MSKERRSLYIPKPAAYSLENGYWQSCHPATIYTKQFTKEQAYENTAAYYVLRRYGFFLERTNRSYENVVKIIQRLKRWLQWRDSK